MTITDLERAPGTAIFIPKEMGPVEFRSILLGRKSQVRIAADAESIERQWSDMRHYCESHDPRLEVIAELEDHESGYDKKAKRPGLKESLRLIEEGIASHLVVARLDRLTRQGPMAFLTILTRIKEAGGTLHILDIPGLGTLDSGSGIGMGILALLAGVASEWSERTSANVKAAERQSAAAGRRHGGRRAYGWHMAPKKILDEDGNRLNLCPSCGAEMKQKDAGGRQVADIQLCPLESAVLREAALAVIGGASIRSIVVDLNRRGVKTASGKEFASATISRALKSSAIKGDRTHLGIEYDGIFPAIISDEEFIAVRRVLAGTESP